MKNFIWIFLMFVFLSGCSTIGMKGKKDKMLFSPEWREEIVKNIPDLSEEEKNTILEGKIPNGMEDRKVEEILGEPYGKYISESGMIEVWFYNDFYVGFDKDKKVIKFGVFNSDISSTPGSEKK